MVKETILIYEQKISKRKFKKEKKEDKDIVAELSANHFKSLFKL